MNSLAPSLDFRFSNFYFTAEDYVTFSGYAEFDNFWLTPDSAMVWNLRDCQLHGGRINLGDLSDGVGIGSASEFKNQNWR